MSVEVGQTVMSLDVVPPIASVWEDGFGLIMVSDVVPEWMKIAFPEEA